MIFFFGGGLENNMDIFLFFSWFGVEEIVETFFFNEDMWTQSRGLEDEFPEFFGAKLFCEFLASASTLPVGLLQAALKQPCIQIAQTRFSKWRDRMGWKKC